MCEGFTHQSRTDVLRREGVCKAETCWTVGGANILCVVESAKQVSKDVNGGADANVHLH